jgi:catechol 2,3-dioxygenase-like lactoylglutathione lyase family enzyme
MLKNHDSSAIVAVRDIGRVRTFYHDTLGLELLDDTMGEVLVFATGATKLVVYRSDEAGGNRANAVVWDVGGDIEAIVAALAAKGVTFEHYEGLGDYAGGIHRSGGMKLAWFRDPDGNVLHLNDM